MADLPINESDASAVIITDATIATRQLTVNSDGSINSAVAASPKSAYSAAAVGFATAALATDIWTITGSATKTVKITRIEMTGTTTAGSGLSVNTQLIKRSATNTGGTSIIDTAVAHDSTNAVATAAVVHYTANPTALGAVVGTIRSARATFATTGADTFLVIWDFGTRPAQPIVLRGTSQLLAINIGSVTIAGSVADISVEWTEE